MVTKTIKVKDSTDISFTFKKTIHGPVLNGIADQIKSHRPISMSWVYNKLENKTLDAFNGIIHANNLNDFKKALEFIHAPGLNIMYGDATGNVAWFATAKLYEMPNGVNTKLVLNGYSGTEEPIRYLDFSENPQAINPPWHYVYSANNQPDSINGKIYPGYYLPENRAKRITQLLDAKNDWDKESAGKMINDVTSSVNPTVMRNYIDALDTSTLTEKQKSLVAILAKWEGDPVVRRLQRQLRTEIVTKSFNEAFVLLEESLGDDYNTWTWNRVHTIEHPHPIGQVAALRKYFNVGPFPVNGTREVINNMSFSYADDGFHKVSSGPSTRRIIDFSDIENSMSILPTGQSGNMFSPHYSDQAQMYVNGEFRKMMMNKDEIQKNAKSVLKILPK